MRRVVAITVSALVAIPALAYSQTSETQMIPDQTIGKAGAALHDVAKLQQKYQGQMDAASPEQKRGLSDRANAEAVEAIRSHGISIQQYTTVVRTAQDNPQLKQRLLDAAKHGD